MPLSSVELFQHELALQLGIPVEFMLSNMSHHELVKWMRFFEARPIGWREDERIFKFLQTQGVKAQSWEVFPSLAAMKAHSDKEVRDPMKSLKGSMMFSKMLSAKGGKDLFSGEGGLFKD